MRFVDLDSFDLIEMLRPYCSFGDCCDIEDEIEKKVVDVVQVVHAKWISKDTLLGKCCKCSNCNSLPNFEYKYCPYCGAKMDGE